MFDAERITGTDFEPNRLIEFLRPPCRRFELMTPISPARAASVLQEIVEPAKTFRWPSSGHHRYFEGWVEGDHFKISRIISDRDSFLPKIQGRFRGEGARTIVTLNMQMAWPVMLFWFGMMLFLLLSLVNTDSRMPDGYGSRIALSAMLLFMYFLASISFAMEVRIAMKQLLELLRSDDIRGDMR
jgi:hypothetical protein